MTTVVATVQDDGIGGFKNCCCGTAPVITSGCPTLFGPGFDTICQGQVYTAGVSATGTEPIVWSISVSGPNELGYNPETGNISGTMVNPGLMSFTYTATNAFGSDSHSCEFNVLAISQIVECPNILKGQFIAFQLTLDPPYVGPSFPTFDVDQLPPGITMTLSGFISGTTTSNTPMTMVFTANSACGESTLSCEYTAVAPEPSKSAEVTIHKYGVSDAVVGDTIPYTIVVENLGPDPADGLKVIDALPALAPVWPNVSVSYTGFAGGPLVVTPAELAAGVAINPFPVGATATFIVSVPAVTPGLWINNAHMQYPPDVAGPSNVALAFTNIT